MLETNIHVKTDHFDGPLGLLLFLIQKEEMDIKNLDITSITGQYLQYLSTMHDLNFDIAGEYLYLASTLCLIKSKFCISDEEAEDLALGFDSSLKIASHSELVKRLEELKHFQKMGQTLWQLPKKGHEIFVRPKINRKKIVNSILTPIDLEKLTLSMMDYLFREKRKYTAIKRDRLSIKEKLEFLKNFLVKGSSTDLSTIIEKDSGIDQQNVADTEDVDSLAKENTVITFISLLELARLRKISLFQNEPFKNIFVKVLKSLDDFDIESADGFEEETADLAIN